MLQGKNRTGRIGTLLFSAKVYYSLRGHQVGTLKSVFSILCHFAFVAAPPTECHSLLALSADRGTPGTPPCGVGSVFERDNVKNRIDWMRDKETRKGTQPNVLMYMTERLFVVDAVYRQSVRFLVQSLGKHSIRHFLESSEVCTCDEVVVKTVCVECIADLIVDACHDAFEL